MEMGRKPVFYFFCCEQGPPEAARYQYGIVPLAEGLADLGFDFYANTNYWPLDRTNRRFLFRGESHVHYEDCDVVVLNDRWFRYGREMPKDLFRRGRRYITVYIDCADGAFTHTFSREWRKFDFIFRAHYNKRIIFMPGNVRPWAFGLTNRIIAATREGKEWEARENILIWNFRTEHPVRKMVRSVLYPFLAEIFTIDNATDEFSFPPEDPDALFEWQKTGRRHYPSYYEKLKRSRAVACFGGKYAHRFAYPTLFRKMVSRYEHILSLGSGILYQWDSFRLWEAFAAGCVAFHVDLEKEGCVLPVMPKNGIHYIGVDLTDLKSAREHIMSLLPHLGQIARGGKQWALEHYSPVAIAKRFLAEIGYECSG